MAKNSKSLGTHMVSSSLLFRFFSLSGEHTLDLWRTWSFCHYHQRLGSSCGSGNSEAFLSQKQKPIYTCLPICHVWAQLPLVWSFYISGFGLAKQKVSVHIQKWISECWHVFRVWLVRHWAFIHACVCVHIGEVVQRRPWGVFTSL